MPTLAMAFDIFARDAASPVFAKVGASATAAAAAVKKAAVSMAAASDAEVTAAGKLRVAELKLAEVRARSKVSASSLAKAEEGLALAQRNHVAAQGRSVRAAEDFATAQTHAADASKKARPHVDNMTKAIGAFIAVDIGRKMVKQAGDFEQGTNVLVTAAGESAGSLKLIREGIQNIATGTGTPLHELTDGMYQVEKAGIRGADGLQVLKAAAQGAREEGANLATVTGAMTSVMASYHLSAKDSVTVMNQLKTAAGESKTTMEAFAGSLNIVLPIASANHISFAQISGALASLTQHGTSADEAAQELANTMRNLAAPNMVAVREMQQLGISSQDVSSKLGERGVAGTLNYLSETILRKMGPGGKLLLDTFMQSQDAGKNLTDMMKAMSPATRQLAQDFVDGKDTAGQWHEEMNSMTGDQSVLAHQFTVTYNRANGFNQAIKNGLPGTQTYTEAIKKMTGGANGLNTTLQLTGESTAGTTERIKRVAEAAKIAGTDVDGWASTQKLFNVQMDMFKQQVEVLGVRIGSALMPRLITATKALGAMLNFVQSNRKWLVPLAATVVALGTAFVVANKSIAAFRKVQEIGAVVQTLGNRIQETGSKLQGFSGGVESVNKRAGSMVSGFGRTVSFLGGPWGAAIALGVTALAGFALAHHEAVKRAKEFTDTLTFENGALDQNSREVETNALAHDGTIDSVLKAGVTAKAYTDALFAGGPARQQMADQLGRIASMGQTVTAAGTGIVVSYTAQGQAALDAGKALGTTGSALDASAHAAAIAADAMGGTATSADSVATATDKAGGATDTYTGKVNKQKAAQDKAKNSLQEMINKFTILRTGALSSAEASMALTTSYLDLSTSLKSNKGALSSHTKAGIEDRTAIIGSVRAINEKITSDFKATEKSKGLKKATEQATEAFKDNRKKLIDTAVAAGANRDAVTKLFDKYAQKPKDLKTPVSQPGMPKAISDTQKLNDKLGNLPSKKNVKITYSSNAATFAKSFKLGLSLNNGERGSTGTTGNARGGIVGEGKAHGGILPGFTPVHMGDDIAFPMAKGGIQPLRSGEGIYVSEAMRDPYERARLMSVNKAALRGESLAKFRQADGLATGGVVSAISTPVNRAGLGLPDFGSLTNRIAVSLGNKLGALIGGGLDKAAAAAAGGPIGGGSYAGALKWARSQVGKPYIFGAAGPRGYDCSGFMAAIQNFIEGKALYHRRYSTPAFHGAKAGGFTRGKRSPFMVGVNPAPGKSGHMAGTLNGVNVESAGGVGVRVGGRARGYNAGMFSWRGGLAHGGLVGDLPFDLIDPRGERYNPRLRKAVRDQGLFDQGGLAHGAGWMPKKTIRPERVLSPQQTVAFDKLVTLLERQGANSSRGPLVHVERVDSGVDLDLFAQRAEFRDRQGSFS